MTATQKPRHHGHDGSDAQGHDEHGRDRIQRTDAHGGHDTTATGTTAMHGHARRTQTRHGHDRAQSHHPQSRIQKNVPAQYHTTRNTSTEQTFQRCICNKPLGRGGSPGPKSRGRWLSSADAECSLEHFWITRYLRSLHIFSGCNRFCTLHIVYNVPWIDVDGGRAQLGSASISGCYHSLRVA